MGGVTAPTRTDVRLVLPCETNPEAFHPDGVGAHNYAAAKKLCAQCPLGPYGPPATKERCLEYALDNDERDGVWGGKSPKERRVIAAARAGEAAGRRGRRRAA